LLRGRKPRLIFRKTNKMIIGQFVKSKESQDFVVCGATSHELLNYGWPKNAEGSLKSTPAAYLTGFLIGKKAEDEGENEAVFDIGLIRHVKGSKVYAFLKGAIDAGLKMKEGPYPEESRIAGKHMSKNIKFNEIKSAIEKKFV
jgi:large subunit ribosomal protein L18